MLTDDSRVPAEAAARELGARRNRIWTASTRKGGSSRENSWRPPAYYTIFVGDRINDTARTCDGRYRAFPWAV